MTMLLGASTVRNYRHAIPRVMNLEINNIMKIENEWKDVQKKDTNKRPSETINRRKTRKKIKYKIQRWDYDSKIKDSDSIRRIQDKDVPNIEDWKQREMDRKNECLIEEKFLINSEKTKSVASWRMNS